MLSLFMKYSMYYEVTNKDKSTLIFLPSSLKGVCHEIFDLHFFHNSNPSRPLINRSNSVSIYPRYSNF